MLGPGVGTFGDLLRRQVGDDPVPDRRVFVGVGAEVFALPQCHGQQRLELLGIVPLHLPAQRDERRLRHRQPDILARPRFALPTLAAPLVLEQLCDDRV